MSYTNVKEFNDTFGVITRIGANVRVREAKLRYRLIREEFKELLDAYDECDIVEVADALGDILYVTFGAAQVFGFTEAELLEEILKLTETYGDVVLTEQGQKNTLELFRKAVLTNSPDIVLSILALIVKSVYDASQSHRLEIDRFVDAIHKSNMTKLDENGKPIRDEHNKIIKGPNYLTPTADIEDLLGFARVETTD